MPDKEHYKIEDIVTAIKGSSAVKATIMRRLNCSRSTVDNYLRRYATAQAAFDEELQMPLDVAESLVINDMVTNRSVKTAKWFLSKKGKSRGYTERSEIDLRVKDVSQLSDDELNAILQA